MSRPLFGHSGLEPKPQTNRHQSIAAAAATARSENEVRIGAGRLEEEGRRHVAHRISLVRMIQNVRNVNRESE